MILYCKLSINYITLLDHQSVSYSVCSCAFRPLDPNRVVTVVMSQLLLVPLHLPFCAPAPTTLPITDTISQRDIITSTYRLQSATGRLFLNPEISGKWEFGTVVDSLSCRTPKPLEHLEHGELLVAYARCLFGPTRHLQGFMRRFYAELAAVILAYQMGVAPLQMMIDASTVTLPSFCQITHPHFKPNQILC